MESVGHFAPAVSLLTWPLEMYSKLMWTGLMSIGNVKGWTGLISIIGNRKCWLWAWIAGITHLVLIVLYKVQYLGPELCVYYVGNSIRLPFR